MKQKNLVLLLSILPLFVSAQCKDNFSKNDNCKFAAGVTLFSDMTYSPGLQIKQPLEFNFMYKLKDSHILRASLPIALKTKVNGYSSYPVYPLTEITPEDYIKKMQTDWGYNSYNKMLEYYYNIYGISLGYEYDYRVYNKFSVFAGIDLAFYHQFIYSKYYNITYGQLSENNQTALGMVSLIKQQSNGNNFVAKPVIGIHYQFQQILFEGSVGYYHSIYSNVEDRQITGWYDPGIVSTTSHQSINQFESNKFAYNISLYYTF